MKSSLPEKGRNWDDIKKDLEKAREGDIDWRKGRIAGLVYYAGDDVLQVAKDAYLTYFSENGVGPKAFPSLVKLESEVIEMALGLFHGGDKASGSMSSGGTESIFLAVKSARDWAHANKDIKEKPEMIVPYTAHPAFNKAAHHLGLRVTRVLQGKDFRADVQAMADAITENTFMLVGSAPQYPHGVVDPIAELGKLALSKGLWLHVDACVGGYIAPFAKSLAYPVPDFDFSVSGVTSISADIHKYGYAAKGASTVLYRDAEYFKYQGFQFDEWPRGHYETNTFTGTRPGGAIAAAWAVMNYLGQEGYQWLTQKVLNAKRALMDGVNSIDGLHTYGDPELGIFTFGSEELDMMAVADAMEEMNWYPNRLSQPPGMHMLLSPVHETITEEYLTDLSLAVGKVKSGKVKSQGKEIGY